MIKLKTIIVLSSLMFSSAVIADPAPVTSLSSTPTPDTTTDVAQDPAGVSHLTLDQRVTVLERQVTAMNQMNLVQQINDLQQQMQALQGQVEILTHTLQVQQTQATSQYADLDERLRKLNESSAVSASVTTQTANIAGSTNKQTQDNPSPDKGDPQNTESASVPSSEADAQTTDLQANHTAVSSPAAEQQAYKIAYDKIKSHNYDEAIGAMQHFIGQYPHGQNAPNAYYWLGQLYLLQGNGKSAEKEFKHVIAQYPTNSKAPDASVRLGFAYLLQNKTDVAKTQFKQVIQQYPKTSAAQIAQARLAQIP